MLETKNIACFFSIPDNFFHEFHFDFSLIFKKLGLGVLQSPVVACLYNAILISYVINHYGEVLSEQTKILLHTLAFIQIIIIVFNLLEPDEMKQTESGLS